ncbi:MULTISPECIES: hypothetical protein [Rhodanobacter]|uniref:Uncharacterized protein n=1 Tax=Rhodanobacter hydrolyticus TaxID=2250595 RepID=A0ABW8J6W2_9GAMM|nr:hypothetical protein [Rhodanobacter sp. 7MK24]MBD8881652.1 hypothetical protein [Rhodanobacter sp. 7MK24]
MIRKICLFLLLSCISWAALSDDAGANRQKWLNMSLYGGDNDAAALKSVSIRKDGGNFKINVSNQFNFECDLSFSENGDPAALSNCKSRDKPSPVCNPDMPNSVCAVSRGCFRQPDEKNPSCFQSWLVKEQEVPLVCSSTKKERVCKGEYTLATMDGYSSSEEFTIARQKD